MERYSSSPEHTSAEIVTLLQETAADNGLPIDSIDFARVLDKWDPLREYRSQFYFPVKSSNHDGEADLPDGVLGGDSERCYRFFCGNSLGLQHKDVQPSIDQELKKWRSQAVEGHFHAPNPWFEIDDILRHDMATIVGAEDSEVVIMNSLTANLHLLLTAFYRPDGKRTKIMSEKFPFPSDTHAFVSQTMLHNLEPADHYITVPPTAPGERVEEGHPSVIPTEEFLKQIERHGEEVAVLVIGAVHFLTGQFFEIEKIVAAAHAKGIIVGVDAAHAVGNVPLQFHDWGVDFACWCSYKYLNAGPGNIAAMFVHSRHSQAVTAASTREGPIRPLRGWWGHHRQSRFSLHREFASSVGAASFQLSNPCVLSIMSLAPSVRLCASISMPRLRQKSLLLTGYMEMLVLMLLKDVVTILTPADCNQRGCQLSIRIHKNTLKARTAATEAYACGNDLRNDADLAQRQLLEKGIMLDNRPPDILRLAPTPTYNSFEDVHHLITTIASLF